MRSKSIRTRLGSRPHSNPTVSQPKNQQETSPAHGYADCLKSPRHQPGTSVPRLALQTSAEKTLAARRMQMMREESLPAA